MPIPIQDVRPGDLITAAFFNQVLAGLRALDARLASLEGGTIPGGRPAITGLFPPGPYRVGDRLTIEGSNFGFTTGALRLFLDQTRVLSFVTADSNDGRLVFDLPPLPGLDEAGTPVTITLSNGGQQATAIVVMRPSTATGGAVGVHFQTVSPAVIAPGQPATFEYRLTSHAPTADLVVTPQVGNVQDAPAWNAQLEVLDAAGNVLPNRTVRLAANATATILVRLPVPANTNGQSFDLSVDVSGGGVVGGTSGSFTVGQGAPPVDATITIARLNVSPPNALAGIEIVRAANDVAARLFLAANIRTPGTYDLTVSTPTGSGWTIARRADTQPTRTFAAGEFAAGVATWPVSFEVTPGANPSATGAVEVRLRRRGAADDQFFRQPVRRG